MRAVVIDDEPLARDGLRLLLADHDVALVGEAGHAHEALALIERVRPDLAFVDVQMPEVSGLELVALLPEPAPAVVFVTAHDEFAVRAFDVHALDYLLKPVDERRFAETVRRARARPRPAADAQVAATAAMPRTDRLAIRDGSSIVLVPVADIDWIEAADYYVEIHVGARSYLHREPIQRLEQRLDPTRFVRIHRSRLVNRDRVREIRTAGKHELVVITTAGVALRVARSCRAKLHGLR